MKQLQQVKEWHEKFDVPIKKTIGIPGATRTMLRAELIKEESKELIMALYNDDLIGIADGLSDLIYVALGTVLEYGLGKLFEEIFDEVHRSNMSKLGENGKPLIRDDGKILKGFNFSPPNLEAIIRATVFLSGPVSGYDFEERKEVFKTAEEKFKSKGYPVFNPCELPQDKNWNELMDICIGELIHMNTIYMLKGWQNSKGASVEHSIALKMGKKIIYE